MPLPRRRAAAAQKLDLPARPVRKPSAPGRNLGRGLGRNPGRHDPPAGRRGRGRLGAPGRAQGAAQGKDGDATRLGGELKAPAGAPLERLDLADDGGEPGTAQGLLHGPEDLRPAAGLDQDQTPGIEAEGGEARGVEVTPAAHPEHRAPGLRCARRPFRKGAEEAREEGEAEAGGGAVVPLRPAALDLVQATERQAAARQMGVERGRPERRGPVPRPGASRAALQGADARAQGREILVTAFQAAVFRVMAFRAVAFRVRHGRAARREGRRGRCGGRYGGKHGVRVLVYSFLFCSSQCRPGSQAPLPSGLCVSV